MDYIERKAVLKQAKEALEVGGVDIERFLVALEQEVQNSGEVYGRFNQMSQYIDDRFDEDFDYDRWALPKIMVEAIGKGLYGEKS